MVIRLIKDVWGGLSFVVVNIWYGFRLLPVRESCTDSFFIRGCRKSDLKRFAAVHEKLRGGRKLSGWRQFVYFFVGDRLVCLVRGGKGEVVGFVMYYFKGKADARRSSIHEAFIGVLPEYQGKGLGTHIRSTMVDCFQRSNINRVTSDIDRGNTASIKSAERAGFSPVKDNEGGDQCVYEIWLSEKNMGNHHK